MKILVVGGTRYFGIPMLAQLLRTGHEVTVASRGIHPNPFSDRTEQIILDRNDPESVRSALAGRHFDVIIDKVAYSSNDVRALLENTACGRYVQMSTGSVYSTDHENIREEEFTAGSYPLVWMNRTEDYRESKRQAERAALEYMPEKDCVFVRYPVVLGPHDYTERLLFYVRHIMHGIPMMIDTPDARRSFIHETEAGEFIAWLCDHPLSSAVNGCSHGTVSAAQIIDYIETKTGRKAVLCSSGEPAPFNASAPFESYDTSRAESTGFRFSRLQEWLFLLLDDYIAKENI